MAEKLNQIVSIIHRYITELQNNGVFPSKIYLYGSMAKGNFHDYSDIDLAVISGKFSGDWFDDRRKIIPLRRQIDERLEPMPFLPEDFHAGNPLAAEVMDHGIEIKLDEVEKVK